MATQYDRREDGNLAQAQQKATASRSAPQNATAGIGTPTDRLATMDRLQSQTQDLRNARELQRAGLPQGLPTPTGNNPARAQAMEAQAAQPVTRPDGTVVQPTKLENQPGIGSQALDVAGTALRTATIPAQAGIAFIGAPVADAVRRTAISAAGGDPETAQGGANKYTEAAQEFYSGSTRPVVDAASNLASSAGQTVLSTTGAKPLQGIGDSAATAGSTPKPAPVGAVNKPQTPPAPGQSQGQQPSGNGYQTAGAGIVGRRGANGTMEFTNDPTAVKGASGQLPGYGDGKGTLSIISGGAEGMARNMRAADIMRQTRQENRGSGLTIVEDSGKMESDNRRAENAVRNLQDRAVAAADRGQSRLAQRLSQSAAQLAGSAAGGRKVQLPPGVGGIGGQPAAPNYLANQSAQLDVAGKEANLRASQRVQSILDELGRNDISADRRAQLETTLAVAQGKPDPRFVDFDNIIGQDAAGTPIKGKSVYDTRTGQTYGIGAGIGAPSQPTGSRSVGSVYRDPQTGISRRFGGVDANGREIWENL